MQRNTMVIPGDDSHAQANTTRMTNILITYSVKEGLVAYNNRLIEEFIRQLRDHSIPGISHSVYQVGHKSFIHICRYKSRLLWEEATHLSAFKQFLKDLEDIVDREPITNTIEEIGHYPN